MLLVDRIVRRIQHILDGVDRVSDISLEFFTLQLLAKLLWFMLDNGQTQLRGEQLTDNMRGYLVKRWKGLTKKPLRVFG